MHARLIKAWVRVCERVCLTLWKFVRICIDCRTDWLKPVGGVRREKKKGITCRQSVKAEMFRGVKKCIWNKDYRGKNQASVLDTQTGMQPNAVSLKHGGVTYVQYITLSQGVIPAFW